MSSLPFLLRTSLWGNLRLRKQLPNAQLNREELQFYRLVLDTAMQGAPSLSSGIDFVFDVGCRNWSYLSALAAFFQNAQFAGIEIDGGRRYWNMHRRIDVAQSHAVALFLEQARIANVVSGDAFRIQRDHVVPKRVGMHSSLAVSLFFPFVSEYPCKSWGIPKENSNFSKLMQHLNTQFPGANWISCHQGEWEADIARKVYQRQMDSGDFSLFTFSEEVLEPSEFKNIWPSPYAVHVFSILKKENR